MMRQSERTTATIHTSEEAARGEVIQAGGQIVLGVRMSAITVIHRCGPERMMQLVVDSLCLNSSCTCIPQGEPRARGYPEAMCMYASVLVGSFV